MAAPEARQPKNWRLVLQQIIDCRDERDKVLMIAQDALNMSQPDPQVCKCGHRREDHMGPLLACVVCQWCNKWRVSQPEPQDTELLERWTDSELGSRIRVIAKYHGNHSDDRNKQRRPGESWSCFVCHEPTDALFALCESHKLATPTAAAGSAPPNDSLWRELLWLNHARYTGCQHLPYGDDGEMQCCGIDFKRWSAEQIGEYLTKRAALQGEPGGEK